MNIVFSILEGDRYGHARNGVHISGSSTYGKYCNIIISANNVNCEIYHQQKEQSIRLKINLKDF